MTISHSARLVILADDLSGAADCATAFVAQGCRVSVCMDMPDALSELDVMALDLDTRRLSPDQARLTVHESSMAFQGCPWLYKKMDSTLRGNWVAETRALRSAGRIALWAPAFPAAGRTVINGEVLVHGIPLEQTDVWRLEHGNLSASIEERASEEGLVLEKIPLSLIRQGPYALCDAIRFAIEQGADVLLFDSETDDDLARVAEATIMFDALPERAPFFWMGSGGLASCLAQRLFSATSTQKIACRQQQSARPFLGIIGSLSPVSADQSRHLQAQHGLERLVIPLSVLRHEHTHDIWLEWQQRLHEAISTGRDVLLEMGAEATVQPAHGPRYAHELAQLVKPLVPLVGTLFLTGGETARAVLSASHIRQIALLGQISVGVALGQAISSAGPFIITKPGAFGDTQTLVAAYECLRDLHAFNEGQYP